MHCCTLKQERCGRKNSVRSCDDAWSRGISAAKSRVDHGVHALTCPAFVEGYSTPSQVITLMAFTHSFVFQQDRARTTRTTTTTTSTECMRSVKKDMYSKKCAWASVYGDYVTTTVQGSRGATTPLYRSWLSMMLHDQTVFLLSLGWFFFLFVQSRTLTGRRTGRLDVEKRVNLSRAPHWDFDKDTKREKHFPHRLPVWLLQNIFFFFQTHSQRHYPLGAIWTVCFEFLRCWRFSTQRYYASLHKVEVLQKETCFSHRGSAWITKYSRK